MAYERKKEFSWQAQCEDAEREIHEQALRISNLTEDLAKVASSLAQARRELTDARAAMGKQLDDERTARQVDGQRYQEWRKSVELKVKTAAEALRLDFPRPGYSLSSDFLLGRISAAVALLPNFESADFFHVDFQRAYQP